MLVFITNPKYFDEKELKDKIVRLVYIFNSKSLFRVLSKKYKCVNIDTKGNIVNENFFPEAEKYKKITKERFLDIKISSYAYFKKKHHSFSRNYYISLRGYKDVVFNMTVEMAKRQKDFNDKVKVLETGILQCISDMFRLQKGDKFVEEYADYFRIMLNLTSSFYRSYVYAFGYKRGYEVFADVFKYNFFSKAALYYTFDKYDIYKEKFHFNYLKILSRLFIEDIHKHDVIGFVDSNINYYKEHGWL